jgi:hypothetical protein
MGEMRVPEGKISLWGPRRRCGDNIEGGLKEIGVEDVTGFNWRGYFEHCNEPPGFIHELWSVQLLSGGGQVFTGAGVAWFEVMSLHQPVTINLRTGSLLDGIRAE